jgi:hypothetical protein
VVERLSGAQQNVDLSGAVVTADAVNAQRDTADYIAGPEDDGGPASDYLLFVKGNQPKLQRAVFDAIQRDCPRDPGYTELDEGHGQAIRRSSWVTGAEDTDFPHVSRVARIRRDGYDSDGTWISKEIVHAVTSLGTERASVADLAKFACGSGASSRCTGCATPPGPKTPTPDGVTEITPTLQAVTRDRNRILDYLPL